jgi:non-lysosomal glucosylceramidase
MSITKFECGSTGYGSGLDRRDFLKLSGLAMSGLALTNLPAIAGPFTRADFEKLVPADKKLRPEWVKSLFARGQRTVYRGPELEKIGMPIGGICAGQVYLGGDGKLWHWDIFNRHVGTGPDHYAHPMKPQSPLDQGFALSISAGDQTQVRPLDRTGWSDISFNGEYPLAFIEYRDAAAPVVVSLEAFSPFVPLHVDDSSLPGTVMRFTVKNTGAQKVEVGLAGWLENAVCLHSGQQREVLRRNRVARRGGYVALECSAEQPPADKVAEKRPDILFDDFERAAYEGWTPTGAAFGSGPIEMSKMPEYQGQVGGHGKRVVNSHATAPGGEVGAKDAATGTLTSKPFTIERNYITFLVGGGAHKGKTCVNLLVDDKVALSTTGKSDNRMAPASWDVRQWAGKIAKIQVVDNETGGWGNISIDDIVFTDQPRAAAGPLAEEQDFGTMALAMLNESPSDLASATLPEVSVPSGLFSKSMADTNTTATRPFGQKLVGALTRKLSLAPGESGEVVFFVTWHFANLKMDRLPPGRHYGTRFNSALAVVEHLAQRYGTLRELTHRWHDTWYDSTLPYWFLDRTFLNTSILATSTSFRFANGRFWGWEGVGCCHGTCGHVWQYAQAMSRLFPALERDTRERVDFGLALQDDGAIHFRAEFNNIPAIDAQAGTILRALREHQMCADDAWLKKNWPGIKKAIEWLIAKDGDGDGDGDGLIVGNQHNTLDTDWFGPVAWLSGMYLAALRAGEEMAKEVGDAEFTQRCRAIFDKGQPNLVRQLFDGEYFINKPDPNHADTINSGTGCHIDQVFGQSWAFQIGLGRVLPEKETGSALKSLWRYNFTPDVGPYRDAYKPGRWYAMPGEGGLLMCSFPRQDWDYAQAKGKGPEWAAGYFNECMNGFEYQVAWHMLAEGLTMEGLAITRMVHDRYHALRRNPWNEIECGDHYARSMASFGVFLAACGYEHHGPKGHLGFAPRLTPENFKCAFTTADGWGSYSQKCGMRNAEYGIQVKFGQLRLRTLSLVPQAGFQPAQVVATLEGKAVPATLAIRDGRCLVQFGSEVMLVAGQSLQVNLS